MSSIFEEITRVVVQEMDAGGDMIAVRSILHADRFHCSSLVRGRRNFWGHQYHRTDLILEDILERGEGEELFEKLDSGPQGQLRFRVLDTGDSKGMLTVKLPKEITIARALHKSHKQRVQMLETHIPQQYLDFLELREAGVGQRGGGEHPFWAPRASEVEVSYDEDAGSLAWAVGPGMKTPTTGKRTYRGLEMTQRLSVIIFPFFPEEGGGSSCLVFFNAAEFLVKTHIESILDILDNLIELSEEQCLMAEAPEKGTLPLQPQAVGDPDV
ncbi:unnamed protein product [Nyctereutes procyonoides]|uniref:(raccoon dog) hypothetical protein n=1 Tax=Nyctereutes procyonoides TaxID=34880 RepID=A0A811XT66_NYCPR|nr:unnamed protein product [Nyctereutes procyonoides]